MNSCLKSLFAIALFAVAISFTSCGDDDRCFECTGFDDGAGNTLDDITICEGDSDGSGGTFTAESLDEAVDLFVLFGGTCEEQ